MKIHVRYLKSQLEGAVKFLSRHHPTYKGKKKYIRNSILKSIDSLVNDDLNDLSTLGYTISVFAKTEESIEFDETVLFIDISVDPGLGYLDDETEDIIFKTI